MKYDVLEPFKNYLSENLTDRTANKYYSSVVKLFQELQFNNISEIDKKYIEKEAPRLFKTKNEFSSVKNGLKHLKNVYPELDIPDEVFFKQTSLKKRNWSKKGNKNIDLNLTKRKINQISNEKLRYAYRLALVSGLRVSELEALEKEDITFSEDKMIVYVRNGKGGKSRTVVCLEDRYLYNNLNKYIDQLNPGEKLFYSEAYMREKADDLDIECHDLRRIFAITDRNLLKKEMSVYEANMKVQEHLGHERFSTTKRYLFNRKLIIETKGATNGSGTGKAIK